MSLTAADFIARLAGTSITQARFNAVTGYAHFALTKDDHTEWLAVRVDELVFGDVAKPFGLALDTTAAQGTEPPRSFLIDPETTVTARERVRERLRRSGLRGI